MGKLFSSKNVFLIYYVFCERLKNCVFQESLNDCLTKQIASFKASVTYFRPSPNYNSNHYNYTASSGLGLGFNIQFITRKLYYQFTRHDWNVQKEPYKPVQFSSFPTGVCLQRSSFGSGLIEQENNVKTPLFRDLSSVHGTNVKIDKRNTLRVYLMV